MRARVKGAIPKAVRVLSPYTSGESNVNSKAVASIVSGDYPTPANIRFWDSVAGSLLKNQTVFDNCAMYAKLMFWAGAIDVMDHSGLATQAIALPQMANYIDYIQLDAGVPGPQTSDFLRAINNGHIMFTRDKDFASNQYDVLCWLAAPGYRVAAAANVRTPDFCYVKWPEVIVTILGYGANFAAPANAMISSARIREFARQLATARGEEADLCRGMYIAFDLLGTRYRTHEDVHYRLDSFLSPAKAPLWSRLAKSEILYREFILRNVDIAPFKEPWDSINLVSSSRLVAWGRSATPRATVVYDTSAAGETLFPNLSSQTDSCSKERRS